MSDLAIYIHYPFCKSKCPYCDFNSHVREGIDAEIWQNAYLTELQKNFEETGRRNITSIFFGGGTPSLMPTKTAAAIVNFIDKNWGLSKDVEITLEANPTSVEYKKFEEFKTAGVNRVSIGVQSFDEAELKFLGREHSANEAKEAISFAQKIFERYSFDLIYALDGQRILDWENSLREALKLTRGHISLYQLTIEENTNFYHRKVPVPSSDLAAEFYNITQIICEANNLPAYEISNHASAGQESRHNLTYWNYGEYLGIGPGAHGRINGYASVQTKSPEKWLQKTVAEKIKLTEQEKFEEKIMMGLRLKQGVKISDFSKLKNLDALISEGLIEKTADGIRATKNGLLVLNSLVERVLQ